LNNSFFLEYDAPSNYVDVIIGHIRDFINSPRARSIRRALIHQNFTLPPYWWLWEEIIYLKLI